MCVRVLFESTDQASTIPSNIRGCQSGMWSAGQEKIRGKSTKLQREHENKNDKKKGTKTMHMAEPLVSGLHVLGTSVCTFRGLWLVFPCLQLSPEIRSRNDRVLLVLSFTKRGHIPLVLLVVVLLLLLLLAP